MRRAELPSQRRDRKRAERVASKGRGDADSESEEEELDESDEETEEGVISADRVAGAMTTGKAVGGKLAPMDLEVTRLKDANSVREAQPTCMSFLLPWRPHTNKGWVALCLNH